MVVAVRVRYNNSPDARAARLRDSRHLASDHHHLPFAFPLGTPSQGKHDRQNDEHHLVYKRILGSKLKSSNDTF